MGKSKARKTIWRTLPIADEHTSDSEESNSTLDTRIHSNCSNHQKYYNPRFNNFSSQSTPTRRYQDSEKSTRSSSTTSENKVTFNEDEYTRITTPRQDVLFKKGYLNKPKNYQTQTSTGTSTNSTGNSTGNGTPDHQSTDLDYESQFVFPNGFVDQNGIYYVNSYDPYPMMVYNPPTYYPEYSHKNKRSSTGSLTESTSPNNEEVSSQDLNQRGNDVISPDFNQVYTVYPGYYYNNGVCSTQEMVNTEYISDSNRIIKRRRRRKLSKSNTDNEDSEYTDDDGTSEEINSDNGHEKTPTREIITPSVVITPETVENIKEEEEEVTNVAQEEMKEEKDLVNPQALLLNGIEKSEPTLNDTNENKTTLDNDNTPIEDTHSCELKPDAEEFIPRALRYQNECMQHQLQYMKMHPNLMPLQFIPHQLSDYQIPHPAGFAIPIGFVPQDPKIYVNYVPTSKAQEVENKQTEDCNDETLESNESDEKTKTKEIDIKSIVSKLEEVKSQQNEITEVTVETEVTRAKEVMVESLPERHQFRQKRFPNRYQPRNGSYAKRNDYTKPQIEYPNHSRHQFHEKEHFGFKSNENTSPRHQKSIAMQNRQFHDKENFDTRENTFDQKVSPRHQQIYKPKPNYHERDHLPPKSREQSIEKSVPHVQKQDHKWKSHNKFNSNSPKRSHVPDSLPLQKEIKILPPPTPKYAETLKKPQPTTPVKQNLLTLNEQPKSETDKKIKPENSLISTPTKTSTPTQWSTVSSRKKRKNRNVEEVDDFDFESEELKTDSEFEVYDVSLLQDVVPEEHFKEEPILGDKSIGIAEELNKLAGAMPNNKEVEITNIPEVSQIEKEIMEVLQTPITEEELVEDFSETKIAQPSKKKSKKGTQKQTAKRVIITDIDLSQTLEKQPPKKDHIEILKNNIKNAEGAKTIKTESKESKPKAEITENVKETLEETVDKVKSKKKKKKPNKTTLSESTTTLNSEDTYDFLLDTSFSCETTEKTNIEISQELDLIIRRGMYSNLEEKIKLINQSDDDFFSTVLSTITPREPSLEKNISYNKTPDFTKIIKHNILPKFKSTMASVDTSYELPKTTSIKNTKAKHVSEASTSKAEVFVENPEVEKMLKNIEQGVETPKAKQDVKTSKRANATLETKVELDLTADTTVKEEETMKKYPITEAIKDWMTKTRENTPEIEILKSPKTILRQFNPELNEEDEEDEEEVLFSTSNKTWREKSVDLLECWEPEITETKERITKPETQVCENGCATKILEGIDDITKAEEELEIYESKYGQNEDFKKIQAELGEQTEKAGFPKHGHLPYRAICCEIM